MDGQHLVAWCSYWVSWKIHGAMGGGRRHRHM